MAALGATVTVEDLNLAGVESEIAKAIVGLTWVEAKAKLSAIVGLAAGNEALVRGAVSSFTVNGRSVTASLSQLKQALETVRVALAYASSTGGISSMPIEWGV